MNRYFCYIYFYIYIYVARPTAETMTVKLKRIRSELDQDISSGTLSQSVWFADVEKDPENYAAPLL